MAVLTVSDLTRNSSITLLALTSVNGSSGVGDIAGVTGGVYARHVGGTTYQTSSEGTAAFGNCDKIGFLIGWYTSEGRVAGSDAQAVRFHKGTYWRNTGTTYTDVTVAATSGAMAKKLMAGPFESSIYGIQATSTTPGVAIGQNYIKFSITGTNTSATNSIYVNIKAFKWPEVTYAT